MEEKREIIINAIREVNDEELINYLLEYILEFIRYYTK